MSAMPYDTSSANSTPLGRNDIRGAGRELLSLALMDSRNSTLHLLAAFEQAAGQGLEVPCREDVELPLWLAGHIAWLAEYWIERNPQRGLGPACPADGVRLAPTEPHADEWFDPALAPHDARWQLQLPGHEGVRAYMLATLENTLELLEKAPEDGPGLHFFRLALLHEDLRREQLVTLAQTLGLTLPVALPVGMQAREPLQVPAATWMLGAVPGSFALDVEKWAHEVPVPEFEIDAHPVHWGQFVEFVGDGGYDRVELWNPEGWHWLSELVGREGRRGPRHVEQIGAAGGAVMQSIFGKPSRMSVSQNVMHVSWWEADAYARWAGRRLPTEVEWEMAAQVAARRGFRWGEVREWTAGTLRPWPGFEPDAWTLHTDFEASPLFGKARVQRGASFAAPQRLHDARLRRFALPHRDDAFVGFRTCAL
jgi:gamma-glutamyl hercynylcysteine S-oxide synthase